MAGPEPGRRQQSPPERGRPRTAQTDRGQRTASRQIPDSFLSCLCCGVSERFLPGGFASSSVPPDRTHGAERQSHQILSSFRNLTSGSVRVNASGRLDVTREVVGICGRSPTVSAAFRPCRFVVIDAPAGSLRPDYCAAVDDGRRSRADATPLTVPEASGMGDETLWCTRRSSMYKGADPGRPNWKSRIGCDRSPVAKSDMLKWAFPSSHRTCSGGVTRARSHSARGVDVSLSW
jgi:hypothetical protein